MMLDPFYEKKITARANAVKAGIEKALNDAKEIGLDKEEDWPNLYREAMAVSDAVSRMLETQKCASRAGNMSQSKTFATASKDLLRGAAALMNPTGENPD